MEIKRLESPTPQSPAVEDIDGIDEAETIEDKEDQEPSRFDDIKFGIMVGTGAFLAGLAMKRTIDWFNTSEKEEYSPGQYNPLNPTFLAVQSASKSLLPSWLNPMTLFTNHSAIALETLHGETSKNLWKLLEDRTPIWAEKQAPVNTHDDDMWAEMPTIVQGSDGTYLNANHMGRTLTKRTLIASQMPLYSELMSNWNIVSEKNAVIVDLLSTTDRKPGTSAIYYPTKLNEMRTFPDPSKSPHITVKLVEENGSVFKYEVTQYPSGKMTIVSRLSFDQWPDAGVIHLVEFIGLIDAVESLGDVALWVHCKAGVGRTGTLITGLILKEMIQDGVVTDIDLEYTLIKTIAKLRSERHPYFVATEGQFNLLREYGRHLLAKKKL